MNGFEHKGIGSALAHNILAVPPNQREYSWEEEHVSRAPDRALGASDGLLGRPMDGRRGLVGSIAHRQAA